MSQPAPGAPTRELPGDPAVGAAAFVLACELPEAAGEADVAEDGDEPWVHEWDDEGETWGISLNGTGSYRRWFGTLAELDTDRTVQIEHPAGTAVVGLEGEALGVLKPNSNEWFCDPDAIPVWEKAALYAIRDRLEGLGHDPPRVDELLEAADGGESA